MTAVIYILHMLFCFILEVSLFNFSSLEFNLKQNSVSVIMMNF